jgi:hypothetical protein
VRTERIPSTARLTLRQSDAGDRQLVQILYSPYERRAPKIDIIEEPASFAQGVVYIRCQTRPRQARLMEFTGRETAMEFGYENGYVKLDLPMVTGQVAISIEA